MNPAPRPRPATSARSAAVVLVLAVALAAVGWALVLRHGFPHGDDWLHAMAGEQPGDARTVRGWLATWQFDYTYRNGRAADAAARLVLLGGRPGALVVGVAIMVLSGLATWPWLRMTGAPRTRPLVRAVIGLGVPFLAVQAHSWLTGEGLLWVSGMANYPLATLAFLVAGAAVSGALPPRVTWLALPVVVYAHLGHEVSAVATLVVTVLALALRRPAGGRARSTWAAIVASALGFAVLATAPGLWRRTAQEDLALPLLQALSRTTLMFASLTLGWWLALGVLALLAVRLSGRAPRRVALVAAAASWLLLLLARRRWPRLADLCADADTAVPATLLALAVVAAAVVLVVGVLVLVVDAWGAAAAYPVLALTAAGVVSAGVPIVASVCGQRAFFLPVTALVLAVACALLLVLGALADGGPCTARAARALTAATLAATLVAAAGYVAVTSQHAARNAAAYDTFVAEVEAARTAGAGEVVVPELPEEGYAYRRAFYLLRYACDLRRFYDLPDGVVLTDAERREDRTTDTTTGCETTWQRTLSRAAEQAPDRR
ncbi:hypothetical protein AVL62_05165 [Serinicoccus chungangensis]|uniref:Glycosyltransferase RgtA/B/C/D-like domain-containing protein n=1 Tax=Serinicoccus chungangensis TaxID=767452 RepID=A0A0W8I8G2_9MICO|nr:DUF6056 family protein [Serinicoccus chungangensis]KUG55686.1 hypothetical protein AVL62_05165 [Serinicoccus chungangensis]